MSDAPTLVVGTAGHIDHGKSRLVLALTGTDPDRLPEEKARGMTIDLGFAHTQIEGCDIFFVDVPGHERFIRNMVAGATGVDVAVLVVAADDSVMPQTREHAEVLSLLGVERCVVVVTKMDLVDDEWADAVEGEARELLAAVGLEPAAFVRTSAETGRGLDELRQVLARLAREQSQRAEPYRWFCLPIDRAFTIAGRGTVVTGSVAHGQVARDDELELWPGGRSVRARDLQSHHDECQQAIGRRRLAINLAGLTREDVRRGCTLATPGYLQPTRCLDVWIAALRIAGKSPRKSIPLRLHIATSEVLAELRLAGGPAAGSIRDQFAQLRTAEPIVATWGQRFILRDESGQRTLGGGRVLRPVAAVWTAKRPPHAEGLRTLLAGEPAARLEEVIRAAEWQPLTYKLLATRAGLANEQAAIEAARRLAQADRVRVFESGSLRLHVHRHWLDELRATLARRLEQFMQENPRLPGLPLSQWPGWMPAACLPRLRPVLAEWFLTSGAAAAADDHIVPPGQARRLSDQDQTLLGQILAEFEAAMYRPPAISELKCCTPRNDKRVRELIELAVRERKLVRITRDMWLHAKHWHELARQVVAAIEQRGEMSVSDLRTMLDSSRKYVVPLVEALDAAGITRLVDGVHKLGPKAAEYQGR